MTTREQLKRAIGTDRSEVGRGVTADPAPSLPERLYAARERKGVDLYRAERDTKIRARYLGALERGDYKELPGRRLHQGLPAQLRALPRARPGRGPRAVAARARRGARAAPVIAVPRPITAPRQGLTFSPSIVVVALLTVVVLAFGAYLGVQVMRFAKPPTIAVTEPATRGHRRRRDDDDLHARGHDAAGGHGLDRNARTRPVPGQRRARRRLDSGRRSAPRPQPVRRHARSTRKPASGPRRRSACSSPCRSWSSRRRR